MMQKLSGIKRMMLKRGKTGEVLQIGANDSIESIDLSNLEKPLDSSGESHSGEHRGGS